MKNNNGKQLGLERHYPRDWFSGDPARICVQVQMDRRGVYIGEDPGKANLRSQCGFQRNLALQSGPARAGEA